jgi:hypothetical protein
MAGAARGADEERALLAPDGFESQVDARAFVNLLGNCSLLEKSFNISKSDEPMWNFMEEVLEFQNDPTKRAKWESALSPSETRACAEFIAGPSHVLTSVRIVFLRPSTIHPAV